MAAITNVVIGGLQEGKLTNKQLKELEELIGGLEDPEINLDVELAISEELLELGKYLTK